MIRSASSARNTRDSAIEIVRQQQKDEEERRRILEAKKIAIEIWATEAAEDGKTSLVIEKDLAVADWLRDLGFSVNGYNKRGHKVTQSMNIASQSRSALYNMVLELSDRYPIGRLMTGIDDPSAVLSYLEWYWKSGKLGAASKRGDLFDILSDYSSLSEIKKIGIEAEINDIQRVFIRMKRHERLCARMGGPMVAGNIDIRDGVLVSWGSGTDFGGQCSEFCSSYVLWVSRWWREVSGYLDDLIASASNNGLSHIDLTLFYSGKCWSILGSESQEGFHPIWFSPSFVSGMLEKAGYEVSSEVFGESFKVWDLKGKYAGISGGDRSRFAYTIKW